MLHRRIFTRRNLAVATSAFVLLAGAAAVGAGGDTSASGDGDTPRSAQAVNDTHQDLIYVSVPPCRLADTRLGGGILGNGTVRAFNAVGNGSFASQGGNASGCGIPAGATSIQATITAVATGAGFVKAYAAGTSEPATAFLNTSSAIAAAVGGVVPIRGNPAPAFNLKNIGASTHLVVDVAGYFIRPLWVRSDGNGMILGSSGGVTNVQVFQNSFGTYYNIHFNRVVSGCNSEVTVSQFPAANGRLAPISIPGSGGLDSVYVMIKSVANENNDFGTATGFNLTVTC